MILLLIMAFSEGFRRRLSLEHHSNPVLCLFKDKVYQTESWQETEYIPDGSNEETLLMGLLTKLALS